MLKTERKQLILEELNQHHVVSLEKLVSLLETSESTVRRDLDELEAENKLRRVHGGAELPHSLQEEETIQEKSVKNLQEKKLLAQKAASLIKEKDVIFIDAGTTTAFLIHELVNKNVTVVTNSIHHAAQLVEKQIPTVMVGENGGNRSMIYTVTLNPSIDYIVRLDQVKVGSVNRMDSDDKFAGGKGINVSRVLKRLNIPNTATGFIGGFTGKFITDTLAEEEIETRFVQVAEDTRINVKIKADQETEINGTGPTVESVQLEELKAILSSLTAEDTVVFAGSSAKNLGNVIYKDLISLTRQTGAQVVCDFEGQTLIDSLDYQPLLVKPNNHELGAIFGVKLESLDEIEKYARELLAKGAQNVIISMAGDGALLVTSEGAYFAKPIKGTVKNSVGAGDSMVAGFTGEFVKSKDVVEAFKWGVACGTATTFSDDLATAEFIKETYGKVEVEKR
ncbi:TPA: 1-phosphofructokinase [Streptococcus pneumoniae]|nr:1-phosphofructokinase [Streptococcus pneumoniae]